MSVRLTCRNCRKPTPHLYRLPRTKKGIPMIRCYPIMACKVCDRAYAK